MSSKPVNLLSVYRAVVPRKPTRRRLKDVAIRNGRAIVTDLDVYACIPTDLPDGVYRPVGQHFEVYPNGVGPSLDDMPALPSMDGAVVGTMLLPREAFKSALNFAAEKNPARLLWGSVCLRIKDIGMEVIATDQFALSRHVVHAPEGLRDGEYIVPAKAIRTLLLDKDAESVTLSVVLVKPYGSFICLDTKRLSIIAHLIDGKYCATDSVIPERLESTYVLDTKEVREAIRTLAPYIDPETRSVRVRDAQDVKDLITGSGSLELSAENAGENLSRTLFINAKKAQGGERMAQNLMLVMPLDLGKLNSGGLYLQHRYLKQVVDSVTSPSLYMGIQGAFSDLKALVFSSEPLCGGETA